jgi:DNA-binding phage protein
MRERGESIAAGYGVSRATIYRALNAPTDPAPA